MLGIVFTGASGVGKSTLARWASRYYQLPLLPSVTSDVYRDAGTTFDEAFGNADNLQEIQRSIHDRTLDRISDVIVARGDGFVTDRGPDVMVYTALMCHKAYPGGWPDHLNGVLMRPDVLTVFVRPCRSIIERARAEDSGRRSMFLSDEWVYRVDGGIAYHLETNNIPHITLEGDDHRGRRSTVIRAVDAVQRAEMIGSVPKIAVRKKPQRKK